MQLYVHCCNLHLNYLLQNQYKFIYRAMSDYIELYKSKDEEYEYSVPVNSVDDPTAVRKAKAAPASNGAARKLSSPSSSQ